MGRIAEARANIDDQRDIYGARDICSGFYHVFKTQVWLHLASGIAQSTAGQI
jgi:hypothetical protein